MVSLVPSDSCAPRLGTKHGRLPLLTNRPRRILLLHPAQVRPLIALLRTTFHTVEDITLDQLTSDSHIAQNLDAIVSETMRLYPPQPITLPRVTNTDCVISSHVVPKGTVVGVDPYSNARSTKTWARASEFRPERWLAGHREFEGDVRAASQPFSIGPRDCVGRRYVGLVCSLSLTQGC